MAERLNPLAVIGKALTANPRAEKRHSRRATKAPTSMRAVMADQLAAHHAKLDADFAAMPLLEVLAHKCPQCTFPLSIEIRGEVEEREEWVKIASRIFCDKCCAFNELVENVQNKISELLHLVSRGATNADTFRAKLKHAEPEERQEYDVKLSNTLSEIEEAWSGYQRALDTLEDIQAKLSEHIDNQSKLIPKEDKYEEIDF